MNGLYILSLMDSTTVTLETKDYISFFLLFKHMKDVVFIYFTSLLIALNAVGATKSPVTLCSLIILK